MGGDLPAPLFDALLRLVARVGSYTDAEAATRTIVRGLVDDLGVEGAALWPCGPRGLGEPVVHGASPDRALADAARDGERRDARGCAWPLRVAGADGLLGVLAVRGTPDEPLRRVVAMLAGRCARILVDARRAETNRMLLAGLSHELRAPLQAMLGYLDLLREGTLGPLDEGQRDALDTVARNAERVIAVAEDVLQVARIDAGGDPPIVGEVDVAELLAREVEQAAPLARRRGLRLDLACPAGLRVHSDGTKLRRIVTNLLTNALKYTDEGAVTVSAAATEGGGCAIEVVDTGPGIPPARREEIFEEYVRLDAGREGTGLGLSIVRRLVRLLGGRVSVADSPPRGSRFRVELPAAAPGAELGAGPGDC